MVSVRGGTVRFCGAVERSGVTVVTAVGELVVERGAAVTLEGGDSVSVTEVVMFSTEGAVVISLVIRVTLV